METVEAAPGTLLLVVRHGETEWNRDERIQGHHDVALSARGVEQAERLAEWLASEPIHAVYSSDLQRARRTADILAAGRAEVREDARLREACMGAFETLTTAEIRARYPEEFQAWRADSARHRPPGGETLECLRRRCVEALNEHLPKHPGQTVLVATHGGSARVIVCGVLGLPLEVYGKLRVENTSVTRLLRRESGWLLAGFNDVSHLRTSAAKPEHTGWEEK